VCVEKLYIDVELTTHAFLE